ncbi:MAG: hypothetical protein KAH77_03790, partial [Thiomargarita sp.]|nr:hypothetical protein [Thiomargarita sp.]
MEVIPLKYGAMFKEAFGQPDIFCHFVKDILGIEINITKVHTEYEYSKPIGFVRSIYDLFAEDTEKRIIVEIQHVKAEDFFDRFLYYHVSSMLHGYKEDSFERTVYTIVMITSTLRDKDINFSCAVSNMNPVSIDDGNRIDLSPHRLIFLCPRKVNDKTPPLIKKWLQFIEDSLDGEMNEKDYQHSPWKKILETIREKTIAPKLLSEIKDDVAWEKAKERFAKEGREEGLITGMAKGKQAGIAEGLQQGKLNIASALLDILDDKTIAQKTKLSIARIRKLRKEG